MTLDGRSQIFSAGIDGSGDAVRLGPLEVRLSMIDEADTATVTWVVGQSGDRPVAVRAVSLVFGVDGAVGALRIFRQGYQSWSPTAVATFGIDGDPSHRADFEFLQAVYHADQRRARDGELRSEWVTLLADAAPGAAPILVGFTAGHDHDGTLRLRPADACVELWAEAFLGDAVLAPGERRPLHDLVVDHRPGEDAAGKLTAWAGVAGRCADARISAPYQVGWCSWYQYFHDVTEDHLRRNLSLAGDWPFDVFQLDDGYQRSIGDWTATNAKFPSTLDGLAAAISAQGRRPGLWLAPFLAAPDSDLARAHPDWMARHQVGGVDRGPLRTWWNPSWGGGEDGFMFGLDTTHPAALAHLEQVAADLVDAGFTYLKLDFTFSPSADGGYADPSRTPAQRVRAGYEAVRRGAGDGAFILGCGVPLSNVVGVVDANRIGQDVAPVWALDPADEVVAGYLDVQPSTRAAYVNTLARSFMHRRLWLNDPDCLMLRSTHTGLSPTAVETWARTVAVSGGMALVSDDLALLDEADRRLLDDVVALGRTSDRRAIAGHPARCEDLLDRMAPTRLAGGGTRLVVDPEAATSLLEPLDPGPDDVAPA